MSFLLSSGVLSAIPDSVRNQYLPSDFTTSNWPDSEGASDITPNNGLSFDANAFGGAGGVTGDGADDYGLADTMGSFGSSMDTDFAISIPINTTDTDSLIHGVANSGDATYLQTSIGWPFSWPGTAGTVRFAIRDVDSNSIIVYTDTDYNDGVNHHIIINKTANSAAGVDIYVDDMTSAASTTIVDDQSFSNPSDFDSGMAYYARNVGGNIQQYLSADQGRIRWFSDSLTGSERQAVHDDLAWT